MGQFCTAVLAPLWQTFVSSFKVYHLSIIQASEDADNVGYDSDGSERSLESFEIQVISCVLYFYSIGNFVLVTFLFYYHCTVVHLVPLLACLLSYSHIFQLFELWTTIVGNSMLAKVSLFNNIHFVHLFSCNNCLCCHTRLLQETLKS